MQTSPPPLRPPLPAVPVLLALSLSLALPAQAREKKHAIAASELPAWVREAAARPAPASDADLIWLLLEKTVEPLPEGGVRLTHRVAARVLKPEGLDLLDSHTVSYRKGDTISLLKAWTLQPDGTARAADPDGDIGDLPAMSSYSVFEDSRQRTISAPAAMVGSVVAFEDEVTHSLDLGAERAVFGDSGRTTVLTRVTLKIPESWGRQAVMFRSEGLVKEDGPRSVTVTAREIAPLAREELRPPPTDLLPTVWLRWWSPDGSRGYADWDAVGRWYQNLTAHVLEESGEAAEIGARLKPAAPDKLLDSIARGFAFAARDVRYVSIQVGIGGYKPHPPGQVCANRYGDCKDKSFLVRSLAAAWGLKSYPVLALTSDDGRVVPEVPSPVQFNHCIAAVALPDGVGAGLWTAMTVDGIGRLLFLDATVRDGSPWLLSPAVQGTSALLVHPGGGKLITLPTQPPEAGSTRRVLTAKLDETGRLTEGTLVETFSGSAALGARDYYAGKSIEQRRRDVLTDLQDRFAGTTVVDYKVDGLDTVEDPVVETTKIEGGRFAKRVGDLLVIEPGREAYGVVSRRLPPPPRKWPLDLGRPREEIVEVTLELPPGWTPEEVPPALKIDSPEITAQSEWRSEEGRLVYRRTARLLMVKIPTERYAAFRDAVHAVEAEDARAVVFVKP